MLPVGLVAEVAIKTSLTSGLALAMLQLMKNRTAAERSFVGHLGLAATLVVPIAALAMPHWAIGGAFLRIYDIATPIWLYAAPAVLLGLATIVAVVRLFGLRRRATVLVEPTWLRALAHAQRRMDFKSGAALLVSPDVTSPVSWGLFRPTIVLDEEVLAAGGEAEAIIAHELAHVARLDWAKLLAARIATTLFWFNPLVWRLARTCHELIEEAADDTVLRHEVDRRDYAAILVGHARHESRGLLLAANGVAPSKGSLRRRVLRVLDTTRRRAPAGLGFAASVLIIGLTLGTPLAAITLRAPEAPVPAPMPRSPWPIPIEAPVTARPVERTASIRPERHPADKLHTQHRLATACVACPIVEFSPQPATSPLPSRFTAGELVAMSTQGVTPEWLRGMAAAGYGDMSGGEITAMAVQGISPDYVRGMAAAGYPRLTAGQLIALKVQDVTPEYPRAITVGGGPRPSPDQLVALKVQGIDPELVRATAEVRAQAIVARDEARELARQRRAAAPPRYSPPVHPRAPRAPAPPDPDDDDN